MPDTIINFSVRNKLLIKKLLRAIQQSIIITLFIVTIGNAQTITTSVSHTNGVFVTQQNFDKNEIVFAAPTDKDNYLTQRIDQVILYRDGKRKKKFNYGSIYGYARNGFRYRKYGGRWDAMSTYGYYKVIDVNGLMLYSKWYQSSTTGGHLWYYYSASANSDIKRINKENIAADFSAHPAFVEAILIALQEDRLFKSDAAVKEMNELYNRFVAK